jgi:hypothetical protein
MVTSPRLTLSTAPPRKYDAVIFAMSGRPFATEDEFTEQNYLVRSVCNEVTRSGCKTFFLVSAHGVGNTSTNANAGIKLMSSWYLRETYSAKESQEEILNDLGKKHEVSIHIIYPKVLSFSNIAVLPEATSRQRLAHDILDRVQTVKKDA